MGRSLKKGPFVDQHLFEKIDKMSEASVKKPIKMPIKKPTAGDDDAPM